MSLASQIQQLQAALLQAHGCPHMVAPLRVNEHSVLSVSISLPETLVSIVLLAVAALLGAARLSQIDKDGMVDRAYRLHYNDSQRRTDLFAAVSLMNRCPHSRALVSLI